MQNPSEPYAACPYCLTKISAPKFESKIKSQDRETPSNKAPDKGKPSGCRYHLGYLSEREQNQQIPEECILCKDIVECMLHKKRA
jgi:hypothetical protein